MWMLTSLIFLLLAVFSVLEDPCVICCQTSIPNWPDRDSHLGSCLHEAASSWFLQAIMMYKRNFQHTVVPASYYTIPNAPLGSFWVKYISSAVSLNAMERKMKSLAFSLKYRLLLLFHIFIEPKSLHRSSKLVTTWWQAVTVHFFYSLILRLLPRDMSKILCGPALRWYKNIFKFLA